MRDRLRTAGVPAWMDAGRWRFEETSEFSTKLAVFLLLIVRRAGFALLNHWLAPLEFH